MKTFIKTGPLKNLIFFGILSFSLVSNAQDGLSDWGEYESVKQAAIQRINQHRKGVVSIKVMLNDQEVAANATVKINQTRHDFLWGAVISRNFLDVPNTEVYQENLLKYFNATGFTIALKPRWRNTNSESAAEDEMEWLLENNFYVRGHALTWEGYNFLRNEDRAIVDNPDLSPEEKGDLLLASLSQHFIHAIPKWEVPVWDVSNEPIDNNIVNDLFQNMDTHAYWFRLADSIRKVHGKEDVLLYQNQYQVISGTTNDALTLTKEGFQSVGRKALYAEIMDRQIAEGAKIEGIGFQSRLRAQWPRITPDSIYSRLRYFERFNLPMQATEFELRDNEQNVFTLEERQILTEYMMVMYLSHPGINGFWHWTFSDIQPNAPTDYALFNYDGTPKNNGIIWMNLMDNFFTTNEDLTSNASGETNALAYHGTHDLTVEVDGQTYTGQFDVKEGSNTAIIVDLEDNEAVITFEEKEETIVTSIDDQYLSESIQIRSNVSSSSIDIRIDDDLLKSNPLKLDLFDLQGKIIFSKQLRDPFTSIQSGSVPQNTILIARISDLLTGQDLSREKVIITGN